jgi:hypothetical protein
MSYLEEAIQHRSAAKQFRDLAEEFDLTRSNDAARIARMRANDEERLAVNADYRGRISDELRELEMNSLEVPMSSARAA